MKRAVPPAFAPKLAPKARLRFDRHARRHLLVYPERGLLLGDVAAAIATQCDGTRSIAEIARELAAAHDGAPEVVLQDVIAFVTELRDKGLLEGVGSGHPDPTYRDGGTPTRSRMVGGPVPVSDPDVRIPTKTAPRPYTLIAELTHRCPLSCPYCSNPLELARLEDELTTAEWREVLQDAEALGVVQVHFTGGEPLARRDLEELVRAARALGLYTNLVTSGVPLDRARLARLAEAGIDHVQVSLQSTRAERADAVAGYPGHARKLEVLRWVKELALPLTINVVLHRDNLDEIDDLVALAEAASADRLELANAQYVAWALTNRGALLPTRTQIEEAAAKAALHKERLKGTIDVLFVKPDYFGTTPKSCMDGWGRRFVHVTPDGRVLPCHAATSIPTLCFESVRERPLFDVWTGSEALNAFRGEGWMPEPCRSCDRRGIDFGGCRCQAFALTGDASATDPACALSPHHAVVVGAAAERTSPEPPAHRRYVHRGR
jgi:PqqA peptide cyclase